MVAASVLPSPVFISAILPSCRTIPPMTCTSKGRSPRVRLEASRTTANASGRMSSRVLLPASRSRNSSVFALKASSESFSTSGSSAETASTRCWRTLTFRPSPILNIFVSKLANVQHQPRFSAPRDGRPCAVRPPLSLEYQRLYCGLYQPVVAVPASVYHVDVARIGAGEHEEVVVEELHLQDRLLCAHRLHLELLGADYAGFDLLCLPHDERFRLYRCFGVGVLDLAVPAVDLAPPVTADLTLELVRHAVYGGVHVLRRLARLQDRPVDEQGRLGHLGVGYGRVALVDQLDLSPRDAAFVVEKLADALDLLQGVSLQRLRHRDVAPLDRYLHVRLPSVGFCTQPSAFSKKRAVATLQRCLRLSPALPVRERRHGTPPSNDPDGKADSSRLKTDG